MRTAGKPPKYIQGENNEMKKIIAAVLCLTMCLAILSACGTETEPDPTDTTEPVTSTEPSAEPSEEPEESTEPSEEPSEEPEESTAPETEAPATEAPATEAPVTNALGDAITAARTDEDNEAYPVFCDKDAIEDMYYQVVGFTASDVDEIAMSVSLINIKAYGIVVVKPAEGCADTVKAGLQAFIDTQCANFETYLADQYEIAKNAKLETLEDGTIVMVMCENADSVYESIVASLGA